MINFHNFDNEIALYRYCVVEHVLSGYYCYIYIFIKTQKNDINNDRHYG